VSVSWDPADGHVLNGRERVDVLGLKLRAKPGRTLSRLTVSERPTLVEVTDAMVPIQVAVGGWNIGLAGSGDGGVGASTLSKETARLRVLGPDDIGQVILEVAALEGRFVQVEQSADLETWVTAWAGLGQGLQSPFRIEPQGGGLPVGRFWRVQETGP